MAVKEKELELVRKNKDSAQTVNVSYDFESAKTDEHPVFELRLIGMRVEEAIAALEHQIDLCALSNFPSFSVIHGKGYGILQQSVHDYLSHCPLVQSFEFANPDEGGSGKTYVTLKS